ncbi:MAG: nitrate/nitrite transporter NrtS [Proteobacteria bacterium]|nr:nitrate/nitrite transporter NrtS [Pseudomonadota bacterium]
MFFTIASRRDVVTRALKTAVIVGVLLVMINHGDAILAGEWTFERILKIGLTVLVPYCVSTYSSVGAIQNEK